MTRWKICVEKKNSIKTIREREKKKTLIRRKNLKIENKK